MYRVGIDVGGTFTDLFAWQDNADETNPVRTAKVLTTPEDPSIGVLEALDAAKIPARDIATLVHGTTIATNAVLTRKYSEPALVTTEGFRDVLEIGRQRREKLYDPYQVKPTPLVSRYNRFTVPEKLGSDGSVVLQLDRSAAHAGGCPEFRGTWVAVR